MIARLMSYVRQHHVGLLALFIALSGTAYAATLPRNSVGPRQLKKNSVTPTKIKANAVTGTKIKNTSLTGNDILLSSLGQVPRARTAATVADNAVTGSGVAEDSLTGADIVESSLEISDRSRGRSSVLGGAQSGGVQSCDPPPTIPCGEVTLHLDRRARVLVMLDGDMQGNAAGLGTCYLTVDGAGIGHSADELLYGDDLAESFSLVAVTPVLSAGDRTFGLVCVEETANIAVDETHIAAVSLSAD